MTLEDVKNAVGYSPPFVGYYWASIFRKRITPFPTARGAGGSKSFQRVRDGHNFVIVGLVVVFFSSVLRIMDRVEESALPQGCDPMAFKRSFSSDFTMLSVTGAIIAQVAITALSLPNLNQVHWTANAGFVTSLVTGCLSVWLSTTTSRLLTSLDTPESIRDWLSGPGCCKHISAFEKELKARLDTRDLISNEEIESIRGEISQFLEDNKWKLPSFYSCTMLSAPSLLLNISLASFLISLGIYLGTVWKKNLDVVAGTVAARAVMICYIVCTVLAFAMFFGSSNRKENEYAFLRRWMIELETKPDVTASCSDIETGNAHSLAESAKRRDAVAAVVEDAPASSI